MRRLKIAAASAAIAALALTACSSNGGSTGSTGGATNGGATQAAEGRGPITYAQGKDTTGKLQGLLDGWNSAHPDEKVTLVELPEKADDQRTAFVQDFQAHAGSYDVAGLDVIWTAEFAARNWLAPLDGLDTSKMFPSMVDTGTYDGKLYAAPFNSNAAFLYYRSDLVKTPPKTWAELESSCPIAKEHNMGCYAGQFAQYEGLTVNFSEAVNSAGGAVVDDKGNMSVNTPQAKAGLEFLVNGFKNGTIPAEAITYQEEESRRAFQQGKLLFLRNWPYVYGLAEQAGADSVVQGKFGIAPIPGQDKVGASTLGGYNMAVNADSKNKATAKDFIAYMTSEEVQRKVLTDMSLPPVVQSLYDDPELQKSVPYLATLKEALLSAVGRPKAVSYNDFSLGVQKEIYPALQGKVSVDDALAALQANGQKIIDAAK